MFCFCYALFALESSFLFLNSEVLYSDYVLCPYIMNNTTPNFFNQFIAPLIRIKFSVENTTVY